ncbi:MAG: class I SAM-dependent methyltransferase [Proteobacteria bacterium]|nr:class I SAM-dependent methyltransferase [Pseudomonadota bacterium]
MKIQVGRILDIQIDYFECLSCGYVQTEAPHWLDRAYREAINDSDTGLMMRNQRNARIVLGTMFMLNILEGVAVDCAGGYGILVRMLRDYGINALWSDPYCKNLVACGFEHESGSADLVTAFEAFEHFKQPSIELDRLLEISPNVLFSTNIIPEPTPKTDEWWYYGKEHGQHIGFFKFRTLQYLAQERGLNLLSNGSSHHLFTSKNINNNLWNLMMRFNKIVPRLLSRKLTSKTWQDHVHIVERS